MERHRLSLETEYVPRFTGRINQKLYRSVFEDKKDIFRPKLEKSVEDKKKQMIQRFDRDSKGFRCTWVVGDRGSGKTQMLTDICLTLIQKGQMRYTKPKHTDRIRPNILLPIFASIPYQMQTRLGRGLTEDDDVFSQLMSLTIKEYADILDELKRAYSQDKLKKKGKFFQLAKNLATVDTSSVRNWEYSQFIEHMDIILEEANIRLILIFDDFDKISSAALEQLFSMRQTEFQDIRGDIVVTTRANGFSTLQSSPGLNYCLGNNMMGTSDNILILPTHVDRPGFVRQALISRFKYVHKSESNDLKWEFLPEEGPSSQRENPEWPFCQLADLDNTGLARLIHQSRMADEQNSLRSILRLAENVFQYSQDKKITKLQAPQVDKIIKELSQTDEGKIRDSVTEMWKDNKFKNGYANLKSCHAGISEEEYSKIENNQIWKNYVIEGFDLLRFGLKLPSRQRTCPICLKPTPYHGCDEDITITGLENFKQMKENEDPFISGILSIFDPDNHSYVMDSTSDVMDIVFTVISDLMLDEAVEDEALRQKKTEQSMVNDKDRINSLTKRGSDKRNWMEKLQRSFAPHHPGSIFEFNEVDDREKNLIVTNFTEKLPAILNAFANHPPEKFAANRDDDPLNLSQLQKGWKEFFKLRGLDTHQSWAVMSKFLSHGLNDSSELIDHIDHLINAARRPPLPSQIWDEYPSLARKFEKMELSDLPGLTDSKIEHKKFESIKIISIDAKVSENGTMGTKDDPIKVTFETTDYTSLEYLCSLPRWFDEVHSEDNTFIQGQKRSTKLGERLNYIITIKCSNNMMNLLLPRLLGKEIIGGREGILLQPNEPVILGKYGFKTPVELELLKAPDELER